MGRASDNEAMSGATVGPIVAGVGALALAADGTEQ